MIISDCKILIKYCEYRDYYNDNQLRWKTPMTDIPSSITNNNTRYIKGNRNKTLTLLSGGTIKFIS